MRLDVALHTGIFYDGYLRGKGGDFTARLLTELPFITQELSFSLLWQHLLDSVRLYSAQTIISAEHQ